MNHRFSPLYRDNEVHSRDDTLAPLLEKVAAQPVIANTGAIALLLMRVSPSGAWSLAEKFKSLLHVSVIDDQTRASE